MKQSREGSYDQAGTQKAREAFEDFINRYPESEKVPQARENLQQLTGGSTKSTLDVAKFYDKTKQFRAAVIYYNDVIKAQPDTTEANYAKTRIEELKAKYGEDALKAAPERAETGAKGGDPSQTAGESGYGCSVRTTWVRQSRCRRQMKWRPDVRSCGRHRLGQVPPVETSLARTRGRSVGRSAGSQESMSRVFLAAALAATAVRTPWLCGVSRGPGQADANGEREDYRRTDLQKRHAGTRVEVLLASTVIKQLQQDGTYKVAREDSADAILEGTLTEIERKPQRSVHGNTLLSREYDLILRVRISPSWSGQPAKELESRSVNGRTSFFVSGSNALAADVNQDERQALPIAAEDWPRGLSRRSAKAGTEAGSDFSHGPPVRTAKCGCIVVVVPCLSVGFNAILLYLELAVKSGHRNLEHLGSLLPVASVELNCLLDESAFLLAHIIIERTADWQG
jgi:hypothetical protein